MSSKWRRASDESGKVFAKMQPKKGDCILHCGHVLNPNTQHCHFFRVADNMQFKRPDGSMGHAKWLVCCDECFDAKGPKFDVRGDAVWPDDDPIITVNQDVN